MNSKIHYARICLILIVSLLLLVSSACSAKPDSSKNKDTGSTITTVLSIEGLENKANLAPAEFTISEGDTALDLLLSSGFDVNVSSGFVTSIDGLENGLEGYPTSGWIYYVNDEMAQTGADEYIIKDGDRISWKYILDYSF